ncbi:hypothetical protein RDWZM_000210 [Blomia tropicalis]|uniref:Drebrin-like protein n=1 Tax=Blomia tropicalis TaxID=40697 RepID=A0A9Q0RPK1_BLOTA|nr:hypothetical protein RDWZM_000210 [Blomia tropicalis]
MAANFYKHHDEIVEAYKEVLDSKCNTNWALFGYEKQTNDIMLVDKGDGGLEELFNEFSQSKILYAFCEAKDQNSQVRRYILINWQGECAPLQRKGLCMNHFADVSSFFKGAHIVLNARNEDDVEPSALMQHVAKVSSRIKFDKPLNDEPIGNQRNPIGTNYKRIVPQNEISQTERESFWQKQKQEEEERLKEAKKKEAEHKLDIINVKRENENETNSQLYEQPKNQNNQVRKERLEEAKSLISKNNINNAKAFFEQNSAVSQINNNNSNKPEKINIHEKVTVETNVNSNGHAKYQEEEIDDVAEKFIEEANNEKMTLRIDSLENCLGMTPTVQEEEEEEEEEDSYIPNVQFSNQSYYPEQRILENIEEEEQENEDTIPAASHSDYGTESASSQGLRAKALYDYQAADDTEISFDPDDIITHIEQIDSGWWQGLSPKGIYGLFPANYVELI